MNPFIEQEWYNKNVIPVEANSAEWLALRRKSIGASEIATVMGFNPFETKLQLWRRKTGQIPDTAMSFRMQAGHYFEDAIARMALDHYDGFTSMYHDIGIRQHPTMPFLTCSLDRWGMSVPSLQPNEVSTSVEWIPEQSLYILDCKNVGVSTYKKIKDATKPPINYWLQIQQQLLVTSFNINPALGYLVYWAGGQMLKMFEIKPCYRTHEIIEDLGSQFQRCVNEMLDPYQNMLDYHNLDVTLMQSLNETSCVAMVVE